MNIRGINLGHFICLFYVCIVYVSKARSALMAMWSKALPMIAICLLPLPGFKSHLGHVGKLPVTWVR